MESLDNKHMSIMHRINEKTEKVKKLMIKNTDIYFKLISIKGMILEEYERLNQLIEKIK